ncbi:hypothetical protein GCM10010246_60060 [Streptomyces cuspidosporus]|uniref:Uncharacterized protein n=1 Tax=Streptomyces cuspidosporus TaxID=66882 RepID=A0ABP5TTG3_9ACTN
MDCRPFMGRSPEGRGTACWWHVFRWGIGSETKEALKGASTSAGARRQILWWGGADGSVRRPRFRWFGTVRADARLDRGPVTLDAGRYPQPPLTAWSLGRAAMSSRRPETASLR